MQVCFAYSYILLLQQLAVAHDSLRKSTKQRAAHQLPTDEQWAFESSTSPSSARSSNRTHFRATCYYGRDVKYTDLADTPPMSEITEPIRACRQNV